MKKICIKCGAEFEAHQPHTDKTLCDACAAQSANRTVLRDRVCMDCGTHFVGYPRSFRCERCNIIHKKEMKRNYEKMKREGKAPGRKIGSVDYCVKCGKEYIVNGGLQRYCPDCAPGEWKKNERARSREWARENIDYEKRQQDREKSKAEIKCVICGKMFTPHAGSITCSSECSKELARKSAQKWEKAHREERTEYHKKRTKEKISAMTDEEYKEYREKKIAKAREHYKKKKMEN